MVFNFNHLKTPGMVQINKEVAYSNWSSRLRRVSGATLVLVGAAILCRTITLLTQMVIAQEFGVSMFSDAYFAMEQVPELFLSLVALGISSVFIPMFTEYRITQGEDEAVRFISSFFFLSTIISLFFAVLTMACSPHFVRALAPGFYGPVRQIAITLLRIMAISVIFLGPNAVIRGLLHSHRQFIVPEFARVIYNSILLGVAWTLIGRYGVFVLAWGIAFASLIWMTIQFIGVAREGVFKLAFVFDHIIAKRAAKQLIPYVIAICGIQVIFLLDRVVASALSEGSIATLNYASRIILLPVGIFALPLRTALYPTLSGLAVKSQLQKLAETTLSGLKVLLFIVIPACVGLTVLSVPLTTLVFERGAFDHLATLATSEALIFYAAGVPAIAAILFLHNIYYCLGDPYTVVKLNFASWATNLSLNVILSGYLGLQGIALATALSTNLTVILMVFLLKRYKLKSLNVKSLLNSMYKIVSISAIMGFLLILLPEELNIVLSQLGLNYQSLHMAILIFLGASTYMMTAWLLRLDELAILTTALRQCSKVKDSS